MTQRLLWPLTRLGETFDLYQRAMASSTRVLDLLQSPIEIIDGDFVALREDAKKSDIVMSDVSFCYSDREPLFTDLNLTITAGQTLGVVGATGAGKSTLTRLLLRFSDIDSGSIEWVGNQVKIGLCHLYVQTSH